MAVSEICDLVEELKKAGFKLTPARLAIVDVLENGPDHLSHDEVLALGKEKYAKLSRATVYRTVEILVELQLLRPIYLHDTAQRFVSATGGHHHLVCTQCGKTVDFDHCTTQQLARELSEKYQFEILGHLLEFHGLCEQCR